MFQLMHTIVPEGSSGLAKIVHDRPSSLQRIHGAIHGMPLEDRTYTWLLIKEDLVMTDADFEQRTNTEVVSESHGDVLIVGLGIGMILVPILKKREVNSVTVIEKERGVIRCVAPHFFPSAKLKIINADVWSWKPSTEARYDTIYFDIWPDICTDYLDDMTKLHRRFRKYLRAGGWMGSWCRDYLRDMKRRSR